jgi:small subunit ribosomal protein S3
MQMGQKIRPTGFRTGVMVGWKSQWYASKQDFSDLLLEDNKIRSFLQKTLRAKNQKGQRPGISKIQIDRTREKVVVTIHSSRVGLIIGKKGAEIDKLTAQLEALTKRHIEIKTIEVNRPETDSQLIAEDIAEQLEKRASFRRTMKNAMQKAMENGAKGIRLQLSGRLGGAEMARCEKAMEGSIPLSTLRTRVEYGFAEASTAQGNIGIKVWVNNGDYLTEETTDAANAQTRQVSKKPARQGKRERQQG